jgi:hypothetical protein
MNGEDKLKHTSAIYPTFQHLYYHLTIRTLHYHCSIFKTIRYGCHIL